MSNLERFVNAVVKDLDEGRPNDAAAKLFEAAYAVSNDYDRAVEMQTAVFEISAREKKNQGADLRIVGSTVQASVSIAHTTQRCPDVQQPNTTRFSGQILGQQQACRPITESIAIMNMTLPAVLPAQQPRNQTFVPPRIKQQQ